MYSMQTQTEGNQIHWRAFRRRLGALGLSSNRILFVIVPGGCKSLNVYYVDRFDSIWSLGLIQVNGFGTWSSCWLLFMVLLTVPTCRTETFD